MPAAAIALSKYEVSFMESVQEIAARFAAKKGNLILDL